MSDQNNSLYPRTCILYKQINNKRNGWRKYFTFFQLLFFPHQNICLKLLKAGKLMQRNNSINDLLNPLISIKLNRLEGKELYNLKWCMQCNLFIAFPFVSSIHASSYFTFNMLHLFAEIDEEKTSFVDNHFCFRK